jgi:hypothetical protein
MISRLVGYGWIAGSLLSVALPASAAAQLIALKTVPVAAGDQFLLTPSDKLGMGGLSIAIADTIGDPFTNPATGSRVVESQVFAVPTYYGISNNAGDARTLPFGMLVRSGQWFGGVTVALQQLKTGNENFWPRPVWFEGGVPQVVDVVPEPLPPDALARQSATNMYGTIMAGTVLPGGVALGVSAALSDLDAVDGVEHLYAGSADIAQSGNTSDFRLGLATTFTGNRTLEVAVLHNRFNMEHDVTYVEWVPIDTTVPDTIPWDWERQVRIERNLDQTRTWGGQVGYRQPMGRSGWQVGGTITANRKNHPKIPNYELVNIPRDPGHSTALELGAGVAKISGGTTFGVDVVFQPAWSETWAEAEGDTVSVGGTPIREGEKTIENSFDFKNAVVSMGAAQVVGPVQLQLGVQVRAYDYHLDQWDNIDESFRRQDEDWMEWTPTWGVRLKLRSVEVRYMGRATTGTGRPGVAWAPDAATREAGFANDIVVAPSGPLTLQDVTVTTHQLSVSVPIR